MAVIGPLVAAGLSYEDVARDLATRSPQQPFRPVEPWSADLVDHVIRQAALLRLADLDAGSSPSGTEEKT